MTTFSSPHALSQGKGAPRLARRQMLWRLTGALSLTSSIAFGQPHEDPVRSPSASKSTSVKPRPKAVAFDVIETLFALEPLRERLKTAGLPGETLEVWFARLLREAFALTVTGVYKSFREVAGATLEALMIEHQLKPAREPRDRVLAGFAELPAHPDAAPAFERLRAAGVRIVTLTNGSADTTRQLLQGAGLEKSLERTISIDEVKRWKPASEVYRHAAKVVGVAPHELALVAAHDWDIHGASRAGLVTGWVGRPRKPYLPVMDPPDVRGATLMEVAQGLLDLKG